MPWGPGGGRCLVPCGPGGGSGLPVLLVVGVCDLHTAMEVPGGGRCLWGLGWEMAGDLRGRM